MKRINANAQPARDANAVRETIEWDILAASRRRDVPAHAGSARDCRIDIGRGAVRCQSTSSPGEYTLSRGGQNDRIYAAIGAPVGLFFTVHRVLHRGSPLDYGTFPQDSMFAARDHGCSCIQNTLVTGRVEVGSLITFYTD